MVKRKPFKNVSHRIASFTSSSKTMGRPFRPVAMETKVITSAITNAIVAAQSGQKKGPVFDWQLARLVTIVGHALSNRTLAVLADDWQKEKQKLKTMKKLIVLLAAGLVASAAYSAEFPDVTVAEVRTVAAAKSAVILDVNGTESYQKGHVPGALDYAAVKDKLEGVLPKDKSTLIIAYCGGPKCKAYQNAAKAAAKLGYTNIKHMSAGISGWQKAGEKMEKSS